MKIFEQHINSTYRRFAEWKNGDPCVVFPIITDLHSALETADRLNSQKRETLSHLLTLNAAAEKFSADFTADLGDIGIDVPVKEPAELDKLCARYFEYRSASKVKPALHVIGNHDILKGVTPEFLHSKSKEINKDCGIVSTENVPYGYFDIADKKCRIFYLFCNETPEFYSNEQFAFVEKNLAELPADWFAIFLQHKCIHSRGRWQKNELAPMPENYLKMHDVFASFIRKGGTIAGVFSGDSHFNLFEKLDNVNYYSNQGYGGIGPSEAPSHAILVHDFCPALNRTDSFDSEKTCLIDVIAVKFEKRELAVFRIGAGNEKFDLFTAY